jgi:hypothetical protein
MDTQLLHIFRNTPLGREAFLQSLYFCQKAGVSPVIYIPKFQKFLMYFENDVVQIDLNESYLTDPGTAAQHAAELVREYGFEPNFFEPKNFTTSTLPDIPTGFDFMCCPGSISGLSSKIGLGYIGPRVRRIVKSAHFPVLITSPVYKPWNSIAVLFGGSVNAFTSLKLGFWLNQHSGLPLAVFTQTEGKQPDEYRKMIQDAGLGQEMETRCVHWHFFESGRFEENLYDIPHDALIVLGAFGHGLIRDFIFGSLMEKVQSVVSNPLLIVGSKYSY